MNIALFVGYGDNPNPDFMGTASSEFLYHYGNSHWWYVLDDII